MNKVLSVLKKYPISTVFAFIIFVLCIVKPPSSIPKLAFTYTDKIAHFGVYFVLAILMILEGHRNKGTEKVKILQQKKMFYNYIIVGVLFGIFIEIVQGFFPYRSFDLNDIVANSIGTICGVLLLGRKYKK